jgi:hypothetical protein
MKELEIIKQALDVANQKGCFNLEDSYTIYHAFKVVESNVKQSEEVKQSVKITKVEKPEYTESRTSNKPNKGNS